LADEGVQFAPLLETVRVEPLTRSGAIDFRRFTVGDPVADSSGGDSPYLYTYWFRGRLGEPEAEKNRDNAAEENEDRYVDTVACFWVNLPDSDASSLQPAQVKDRLLQSITDSWRRYYASEYVRPPGNHSLPLYQHRAGNLKTGYITSGRMGPTYQISTGVELAGN
jgi:hypothetical protein